LQAPRPQQAALPVRVRVRAAGTRIIGQGLGMRAVVRAAFTSTRTLATAAGRGTAAAAVGKLVFLLPLPGHQSARQRSQPLGLTSAQRRFRRERGPVLLPPLRQSQQPRRQLPREHA
jgi:hypothetical protein